MLKFSSYPRFIEEIQTGTHYVCHNGRMCIICKEGVWNAWASVAFPPMSCYLQARDCLWHTYTIQIRDMQRCKCLSNHVALPVPEHTVACECLACGSQAHLSFRCLQGDKEVRNHLPLLFDKTKMWSIGAIPHMGLNPNEHLDVSCIRIQMDLLEFIRGVGVDVLYTHKEGSVVLSTIREKSHRHLSVHFVEKCAPGDETTLCNLVYAQVHQNSVPRFFEATMPIAFWRFMFVALDLVICTTSLKVDTKCNIALDKQNVMWISTPDISTNIFCENTLIEK